MFDWENILNFQGETGPYIQYIYVRTRSVLEKAGYVVDISDVKPELLAEKETINVLKLLYNFSSMLELAAEKNEPSIVARYLIDLAGAYSSFYNEHKILCEDKELQDARLFLTQSLRNSFKNRGRVIRNGNA